MKSTKRFTQLQLEVLDKLIRENGTTRDYGDGVPIKEVMEDGDAFAVELEDKGSGRGIWVNQEKVGVV